jgi:ubiquinone/menaquinone biosynthesis C-methylase UbiE
MLDNGIRRLFQNPKNIVGPYVKEGMTVIDIGSGPGMFTLAMAAMIGNTGKIIAVDLQQEMLDLVREKSEKQNMSSRIQLHKNQPGSIGISEKADFILSFYMVHEVPDRDAFLREVHGLLKPGGKYLIVEPKFHVSREAFEDTVEDAKKAGFRPVSFPKILGGRSALFTLAD